MGSLGTPLLNAYSRILDKVAQGIQTAATFDLLERWRFDWHAPTAVTNGSTPSQAAGTPAAFSPAELEKLLAAIGAIVDTIGGNLTMRHAAIAVTATRGAAP